MEESDEEQIVVVACLLAEEEELEKKVKRKHSIWIHDIFKKRSEHGEYHTLFPDLSNDDIKFFQYFRMSQAKFHYLVDTLKPHLLRQNTKYREAIGPEERLAVCLRYLATGNSFRSLAFSFRMGERTVREIVYSTCEAIIEVLQPIVMPKPSEDTWIESEKGFYEKWNFPNAIAAIDGKHVLIQAPPHSGSNYFCYKKHFSLVLLALVDADKKFIVVDVGAFGKNSDASILRNSSLGKGLQDGTLNIPPRKIPPGGTEPLPHVIIGDEAFPLCTYLMRPYSRDDAQRNEEKKVFNYRLSRARNTHIVTVVMTTCCLHNFLRNDSCHWTENDLNTSMRGLQNLRNVGGNSRTDALAVRDSFKSYFNSEAGSVDWQLRRIRAGMRVNV
ncbi:hypothetical protein ABMA27_003460 [Loxostege sticticalis]|uniref:DDE Tnp4 domain-containing protein n=1 Tax=Loxostege sticticalis TaxID=481309 RepID=A0ABR3HT48_LOXSC